MEKEIMALTHPIPTQFAERIYENNKTVFVSKRQLKNVSPGDKFVIYESHGARAYTGWADIKSITKMSPRRIIMTYKDDLILTGEEFREYSKDKKYMSVIEFKNFEMFKNKVVPKRFVSMSGKYIYKDEFNHIIENKD
ncbi:MAG: DUF365 domain-containing protein [Methanobacterium sp.]